MPEQYFYDLASQGTGAFTFSPTEIRYVVARVNTWPASVSLFPAPGQHRFAHLGWIALANDLAPTLMEPGLYLYEPIWLESTRQQRGFVVGTRYASHLAWSLEPGVGASVYVLTW